MTGKEMIIQYLQQHPTGTFQLIASANRPIDKTRISCAIVEMGYRGEVMFTGTRRSKVYRLPTEAEKPKPSAGNSIFDECRANWPGYQLNQLIRGVRA